MKRLTGKLVRAARRRIARRRGLPTSSVQIYRGYTDRRVDRYDWRFTWRVVIDGPSQGTDVWWTDVRGFLEDALERHG